MSGLLELAERCEAAHEVETRALLTEAFDLCHVRQLPSRPGTVHHNPLWLQFSVYLGAKAWTDAAMTLVPDAWILTLTVYHDASYARLADDRINPVRLDDAEVEAATPALALCAAALRARAEQSA